MAYSRFSRVTMTGMQRHASVWLLREHPFNSFEVLEQVLIKILAQAQKEEEGSNSRVQGQKTRQHEHVPERQSGTDVSRPESHSSSRSTNPTPRTVCISLRSKGSSTLRRRRLI